MKIYTILKETLEKIKTAISALEQKKINKKWVYLTNGNGVLSFDMDGYTELQFIVYFGGVYVEGIVPQHMIGDSASTVMIGFYGGNPIYVEYSKTTARISSYPNGYPNASLFVYAR